jgi:hypothetical protein
LPSWLALYLRPRLINRHDDQLLLNLTADRQFEGDFLKLLLAHCLEIYCSGITVKGIAVTLRLFPLDLIYLSADCRPQGKSLNDAVIKPSSA